MAEYEGSSEDPMEHRTESHKDLIEDPGEHRTEEHDGPIEGPNKHRIEEGPSQAPLMGRRVQPARKK